MAKYYVESGELRKIVEAVSPICAAARAISLVTEDEWSDLRMNAVITVNERGYVRDRPYRRHQEGDIVIETGTLMAILSEHDL